MRLQRRGMTAWPLGSLSAISAHYRGHVIHLVLKPTSAADDLACRSLRIAWIPQRCTRWADEAAVHIRLLTAQRPMGMTNAAVTSRPPDLRHVVDRHLARLDLLAHGFIPSRPESSQRFGTRQHLAAQLQVLVAQPAHDPRKRVTGNRLLGLDGREHCPVKPLIACRQAKILPKPLRIARGQVL